MALCSVITVTKRWFSSQKPYYWQMKDCAAIQAKQFELETKITGLYSHNFTFNNGEIISIAEFDVNLEIICISLGKIINGIIHKGIQESINKNVVSCWGPDQGGEENHYPRLYIYKDNYSKTKQYFSQFATRGHITNGFMMPSMDSFIFLNALNTYFKYNNYQNNKYQNVIDICCGSGIIGKYFVDRYMINDNNNNIHQKIKLLDIDDTFIKYVESDEFGLINYENPLKYIHPITNNMVSYINNNTNNTFYDLIMCNPPYIPLYNDIVKHNQTKTNVSENNINFAVGIQCVLNCLDFISIKTKTRELIFSVSTITLCSDKVIEKIKYIQENYKINIRVLSKKEIVFKKDSIVSLDEIDGNDYFWNKQDIKPKDYLEKTGIIINDINDGNINLMKGWSKQKENTLTLKNANNIPNIDDLKYFHIVYILWLYH